MYPRFGNQASSNGGGTDDRSRHIRSLLSANKTLTQKSDDVFELGIRLKDGKVLVLQVRLPDHFPVASPEIKFVGDKVSHPWVDDAGRVVGCNNLYAWHPRTSNLGRLVHEVVHEFCVRPPEVSPTATASNPPPSYSAAYKGPTSSPIRAQGFQSQQGYQSKQRDGIALPPVPDRFPDLESMSAMQLQELLNNDAKFHEYFLALDQVTTISQLRDQMANENVEIAKENLSHDEEIRLLTAQVQSLRDTAKESRSEFEQLVEKQKEASGSKSPAELIGELKNLAKEVEDESEELSFGFMEGDISVAEFAKSHFTKRTLYHERKAKIECLEAQVVAQEN